MLDGIDSGQNRPLAGFGAVRVRGGLAMQRVRFIHQRVQLGLGQLRNVHVVGGRKHAAAGAGLDHVGAVLDVEPHRVARLVGRIDDAVFGAGLAAEQAKTKAVAVVAVAAGGSQRVHRNQHARTRHDPALMELRSPTSMKLDDPTSRTVVKPAITVLRALAVARMACSEMGRCSESSALPL